MPKLKTNLGKAEYDALDESLKSLYIANGDSFKLDADFEDVSGLKAKRDELLGKVTEMSKTLKAFEGLDPEKAKEALTKVTEIEDGQLLKKQQFDELFNKKKGEWDAEREGLLKKIDTIVAKSAKRDLAMKLAENGVNPTLANDLALVLTNEHIKYAEDNGEAIWKTMDGLETVDLDKYIPGLKESKAAYFNSKLAPGAGTTPGSKENNGGSQKTATRQEWDAMSVEQRSAFSNDGGTLTN